MFVPVLRLLVPAMLTMSLASTVFAGPADVVGVKVQKSAPGVYNFAVTVRHADSGWTHYADAWEVVDAKGQVLGTRVLAHPHDNEQPFTRSLSGVKIPANVDRVRLRARDKMHGFGAAEVVVKLPR